MKVRSIVYALPAAVLSVLLWTSVAFAERAQPTRPDANPAMDRYLAAIAKDARVQAVIGKFASEDFSKNRFKEHMEVVRIMSPSRMEMYRGIEMANRFKSAGFNGEPNSAYYVVFNHSGNLPGAAIQLIDGLPVWNACAVIKGSTPDSVVDNVNIFSRPKVVIEGHIDTVNPASIDMSVKDGTIPQSAYGVVKIAPAGDAIVSSNAELAAIKDELHFDANNKIIEDDNFKKAYKRFDNLTDATKNGGYRVYVPGYSDAMNNTMSVYQMAKLMKEQAIKPVYDIWFCMTSGEEGRGNLVGMKQLYGYNQDYNHNDPKMTPEEKLAMKGKNKLNIVANMSIDGSNLAIHYLGSYRYEVNYKAAEGGNAPMAAARAIAGIADQKSPSEEDKAKPRTTYTVGVVYPKTGDGMTDSSFEIDMRAPVPGVLDEMKAKLYPWFQKGAELENKQSGKELVKYNQLWFGDRPAHRRNFDLMATDPMIYAGWKSFELAKVGNKPMTLPQYPKDSSSLNDNIPAAIGIPSVNLNIGVPAAKGGGHAFNEWGVLGKIEPEKASFARVLYTLLAVSGMDASNGKNIVPAAYGKKAPRHVNETWE